MGKDRVGQVERGGASGRNAAVTKTYCPDCGVVLPLADRPYLDSNNTGKVYT